MINRSYIAQECNCKCNIPAHHNFLTYHRPAIRAENKITKRTGELCYLVLCTYCRPMMSEKIMTSRY